MLARTDSRARALVLLLLVSRRGDGDRRAPGVVAGRWSATGWPPWRCTSSPSTRAPGRARRDHGRQRRAPGHLGRAAVGLRHAADRSTDPEQAAARCSRSILRSTREVLRERLIERRPVGRGSRGGSSRADAERIRELDIRGHRHAAGDEARLPGRRGRDRDDHGRAGHRLRRHDEGERRVGYGVEQGENGLLGRRAGQRDAPRRTSIGRRIADSVSLLSEPIDGADLRLTIDAGVQHLLEQAIWDDVSAEQRAGRHRPDHERGDRRHPGAWPASRPTTPTEFATTDGELFSNPAISRQYEPGSVMKAFTDRRRARRRARSRTDRHVRRRQQPPASRASASRTPTASTIPYGHGAITAGDVLALSNNVGAAKIGLELGGAGAVRGIPALRVRAADRDRARRRGDRAWSGTRRPNASGDLTTAQNAFGQGLSLTAVQLVAGYAAFANGGHARHAARRRRLDRSGRHDHAAEQPPAERIIRAGDGRHDARAAHQRHRRRHRQGRADPRLHGRRQDGHGPDRRPGPGDERRTARTVERWQYINGWVDSSFVGILPAGDTKLVTLILIHRPVPWDRRMPERPENVFARPHAPGARLPRHPPGPPARTGRAARDAARLARSPQRGPRASDHPTRRPAGRHRRPPHRPDRRHRVSRGAAVDSRRVTPGTLFVALPRRARRRAPLRRRCGRGRCGRGARRARGRPPAGRRRAPWCRPRPADRPPGARGLVASAPRGAGGRHHRLDGQDDRQGDHRRRPRRARSARFATRATSTPRAGCR